ncbi:hypothetical protein HanXRQr2_Chr15g0672181 [Helianthus annuus]|uniref:Reverse transcriptase zinc-binding domain-containing protein n=1 Tax=Helianthus annuus TaxID=4232 RepID=A0A9K3DXG1_HELAN|nr:hypothetical protein HanXRQr2_Chr15g0672181 [Helianthus annuus]
MCLLCGEYEETSEHLFVGCHFAQTVWLVIEQWCKIPSMFAFSLRDILDHHNMIHGCKKKKKVFNAIAQVVLWSIWRMRNEVLYGRGSPNISKVIEEAKNMAYHWIKNRSRSLHWTWEEWCTFSMAM